jgi:polyphosphate kinase
VTVDRSPFNPFGRLEGRDLYGGTAAPDCTPFCADDPQLFNDRELSFLRFQQRIFEEAQDETTPLLDRVKFLAIVGTHLDDFVRIRGPELRRNVARRMVVESVLKRLLYHVEVYWRRHLRPALRAAGIHVIRYKHLTARERREVDRHFVDLVRPTLSPVSYGQPAPFPQIASLGMNFMVRALDAAGRERRFVLRLPDAIPSLLPFTLAREQSAAAPDTVETPGGYVWLDQVVAAHLPMLFPDMQSIAAHRFRLLREVDVRSQALVTVGPIERVLEVIRLREANPVVALIVDRRMPADLLGGLARALDVPESAVHRVGAVSDLRRLWEFTRIVRPDLRSPHFVPHEPAALGGHTGVLAAARERDILFHHPYESFEPVVEMIRQAADDPHVTRISLTLYRTDRESPIVHALLDAIRQGKQVRVLIELHARLDEHRNANWWRIFEQEGATVCTSPAGLKVHAKMALIERNEAGGIRRYAHLSSGNYNAFTARVYTDIGLLTCDDDITADVAELFDGLCGGATPGRFRALIVAPLAMRQTLRTLIEREIACHRRGERAHIILKMNGLVDRDVIALLYRASQEGVPIDLLVRSMCCLRPGVAGLSDGIRVRSIVGRFLEHSRVWYFRNGGDEEVYIGSADLMPRNLERRIEVMAPIKKTSLRRRVVEMLGVYLADNVKARELRADGSYVRVAAEAGEPLVDAQLALLQAAAAPVLTSDSRRHLVLVRDAE